MMTTTDDDPRVYNPWKSDDEEGFDPRKISREFMGSGQKEPKEKRAKEERPESQTEAEIDPFGL